MSAKQIRRWRPACRPQTRWIRGVLSLQMGENLLDNRRIFDAGNDPHRPTAGTEGFNVDVEHPFQASPPGAYFWCAQVIDARRSAGVGSCPSALALSL